MRKSISYLDFTINNFTSIDISDDFNERNNKLKCLN